MIPISDDAGYRRRFPIVNIGLIIVNVVVFVAELANGPCFQADYSLVPYAVTHGLPAQFQGCPVGQPTPVYVTLVTAMFLHANWLHIAGNMLYLWIFGDNVEDRLGHFWYLLFYLFCGLVANAAQIAFDPNSTVINLGASGAIAGVLAAYLVFFPTARVRTIIFLGFFFTLATLNALIVIGLWFVLQLVYSISTVTMAGQSAQGGVAYFAHVGGFVAGLVIALIVRALSKPRHPRNAQTYPYWPQYGNLRG